MGLWELMTLYASLVGKGLTLSHPMTPYGVMVSHKLMGIYIFNTRRYTIVHGFCLYKLFLMGGKELKHEKEGSVRLLGGYSLRTV